MADIGLIVAPALLIALISLDHTAVGQCMLSAPLVGGWLMGHIFGDPMGGLVAGALLQFLCFVELPVGATVPLDGSLAGLIGAALFLTTSRPPQWGDAAMLGLTVLLFFPVATLSRFLEVRVCRLNRYWTTVAIDQAGKGRLVGAQLASLGGIPLFFLKALFIGLLVLGLFPVLTAAFPGGAAFLSRPLAILGRLAPFVGLGVLATSQRRVRPVRFLALGFLLGVTLTWTVG